MRREPAARRKSRLFYLSLAGLAAVALVVGIAVWRHGQAGHTAAPPRVPVTATEQLSAMSRSITTRSAPFRRSTRSPFAPRSPARLCPIDFRQGQEVRKGDVLAKIDPAPFKAALDQTVAKKSEDEAQLIDAQKDLARFAHLVLKNFETHQNVDLQQAKVDQFKATIDADQGAIEAAQTQLNYATIIAPIDGVVGFRQVDIGNIIHTTDPNPLTVLTQIKPAQVIFTLPQSDLGPVREAMLHGSVSVLAFDQNDKEQLAQGHICC